MIYIDIYIYHCGVFNLVVIMTENEKFYYIVYTIQGDAFGERNTGILDRHPVDFVIETKNNITILYSIEITKKQAVEFNDIMRND